jgi:hypothetical protein
MNMASCSPCCGSQDMVCIWHMCEELESNNKNVMSSSYFYPSSENAARQSKTAAALKFHLQQHKERAIKKAWTTLSRRVDALFCNEVTVTCTQRVGLLK